MGIKEKKRNFFGREISALRDGIMRCSRNDGSDASWFR